MTELGIVLNRAQGELRDLSPGVGAAFVAVEHVRRAAVDARPVLAAGAHDGRVTRKRHGIAKKVVILNVAWLELRDPAPSTRTALVAQEHERCTATVAAAVARPRTNKRGVAGHGCDAKVPHHVAWVRDELAVLSPYDASSSLADEAAGVRRARHN